MVNAEHHRGVSGHVATEDIKFGYCTEIMVRIGEGQPWTALLIMKHSETT